MEWRRLRALLLSGRAIKVRNVPSVVGLSTSALRDKADMTFYGANVRLWPKADIGGPLTAPFRTAMLQRKWRVGVGTATCADEISSKLSLDQRSRARIWRGHSKTDE